LPTPAFLLLDFEFDESLRQAFIKDLKYLDLIKSRSLVVPFRNEWSNIVDPGKD